MAGSLSLAALTLAWPRARLAGLCTLIVLTGWTNHTLRTADWRLHRFFDHNELYNIRTDIGEKQDLAAAQPKKTEELRARSPGRRHFEVVHRDNLVLL